MRRGVEQLMRMEPRPDPGGIRIVLEVLSNPVNESLSLTRPFDLRGLTRTLF